GGEEDPRQPRPGETGAEKHAPAGQGRRAPEILAGAPRPGGRRGAGAAPRADPRGEGGHARRVRSLRTQDQGKECGMNKPAELNLGTVPVWINGKPVSAARRFGDVFNPASGQVTKRVVFSDASLV